MRDGSFSKPPTDHAISEDQVRERAYDIWERHHRPDGFEAHFWLLAKRELVAEHKARLVSEVADEREIKCRDDNIE